MRIADKVSQRPALAAWLCAALALAFALPQLGDLDGLGHPDEAFYLSIASDMIHGHRWMPSHDGLYVFQKPPLVFWAARLSMTIFGDNAAAARLPGALAAAALCGAGALLATELAGAPAGLLAGLFLVGSLGVERFGRELMIDLPLAACLTAALACLAHALAAPEPRRRTLLAAGFFAGLSWGIKGPIGPLLLLAAGTMTLALVRRLGLLRRGALWAGIGLGLLPVAPWYAWAIAEHPREFWLIHVVEQHFARFEVAHGQDPWNLLWGILLYTLPFTPLALLGFARAWSSRESRLADALPLAWIGAFLVLFGLPKEHGLHYPVLILAPLAALAARAALSSSRMGRLLRKGTAVALGLLAALAILPLRFPGIAPWIGIAMALALFGAAWGWSREAPQGAGWGSLGGALAACVAIGYLGPALAGPLVPPSAAALGRGRIVGVLQDHPGPFNLAASWQGAYEIFGRGQLQRAIDRGDLILVRDHALADLEPGPALRLLPLTTWRRARPYLRPSDIWNAWLARDLDRLRERCGLYRVGS